MSARERNRVSESDREKVSPYSSEPVAQIPTGLTALSRHFEAESRYMRLQGKKQMRYRFDFFMKLPRKLLDDFGPSDGCSWMRTHRDSDRHFFA